MGRIVVGTKRLVELKEAETTAVKLAFASFSLRGLMSHSLVSSQGEEWKIIKIDNNKT